MKCFVFTARQYERARNAEKAARSSVSWTRCWWCNGYLGSPWSRDPRVKFCTKCGERSVDPAFLLREIAADMANRPPAFTGGIQANHT